MESEQGKKKRFVMFSEDLIKATYMTSAEKFLLICILRKARQDDFMFASIASLVGDTGLCNKTIIKMLKHFEEIKLIHQQPMSVGVKNVGTIRFINRAHPLLTFDENERSESCIPERKFVPDVAMQGKASAAFNKWLDAHPKKQRHGFGEL